MSLSAASSIVDDWKTCKAAYDDALFFTGVSKGWAEGSTQRWRDYLALVAGDFKIKHGLEFDPKKPITHKETAQCATSN